MRAACRAAWGFVLLLAALPAPALDPDKAFHHYVQDVWSIEHGLPQITVLAIAQDPTGYIWLGTQAGLARFDGVHFIRYDQNNAPALPGLYVNGLTLDRGGRLWVATYKGVAVIEDGVLRAVPAADTGTWPVIEANAIVEGADGRILVGATQGLFEVDGGTVVKAPEGVDRAALALLEHEGALWLGSRGTVLRLQGGQVQRLDLPAEVASAAVNALAHAQGALWAGTNAGLFRLREGAWERFHGHPALASAPVHAMYLDRDGNFWISTQQGLARLHGGEVVEFVDDINPAAHRSVRAFAEDHEGNLWLGSQWEGLARLWSGWTRRYSVAEGLHEPIVWSVAPGPDQSVYVGTNDGLTQLRGNRFERLVGGGELPHPHAYTLLVEDGTVWIGTRAGLAVLDARGLRRPAEYAAIGGAQVNGIHRARDGRLWFATTDGLYGSVPGGLERFGTEAGLADARVRGVRETGEGLLVGTQVGLYRFEDGRLLPVGLDAGLPADIDVTAMHELADGTLVLGTLSEQLFVRHEGRWVELNTHHGIPVNSPFFITDRDGWLWVAGIRGIARVPLAQLHAFAAGQIQRVDGEMLLNERGDRRSGQRGFCCNGAGLAKGFLRGDELWLPSRDGVVAMPTGGIERNPHAPNVLIERMRVGQEWLPASAAQGLALAPQSRDLGFEFTALSFRDPESLQLRYRLQGYDQEWQFADPNGRRQAVYTNLPPGDYGFEVEASNEADVWSRAPARLDFSIRPYFHETGWFFALIALAAAALVWSGYRYKVRALTANRRELEGLVARRTDDLAAANRRLEAMSQTDPLTGLKNRRYLVNQIPADLAFYEREAMRPGQDDQVMVFAMVDVDHFKAINDSHGHKAGDRVLQQFARVLLEQVRTGDYVVRWGGEEFLLVFRPMPARKSVVIAERVRQAVAAHPFDIGQAASLRITASVGFVEYPLFRDSEHALGWESMVELADHALYYVKSRGRNGWAAFRPTGSTDVATVIEDLRGDLEGLVAEGRLEVVSSHGITA